MYIEKQRGQCDEMNTVKHYENRTDRKQSKTRTTEIDDFKIKQETWNKYMSDQTKHNHEQRTRIQSIQNILYLYIQMCECVKTF